MTVFYIPCPDKKSAERIGRELLKKKLAGCYNFFPIESGYRWKGKIVRDKEVVLIAKTLEKLVKKVESFVKKNHPYAVPCIISLDAETVNKEYLEWMNGEVSLRGV